MKNIKSHFRFNKQERSGIFFLLLVIILFQGAHFYFNIQSVPETESPFSVNAELQAEIDALKKLQAEKDSFKMYPFNPNFISDHKGYALGMSVMEIDRLHAFRALNQFANSVDEFQEVTQVSDSLLHKISPYFKFPEWTQKKSKRLTTSSTAAKSSMLVRQKVVEVRDLNLITAEELKIINGIGEKLSARIIKFRNRLGGVLVNEQLLDVYGLEPIVVERTLKRFRVLQPPQIKQININTASINEISNLVYISYSVAQKIVDYRENNGRINSFDELRDIEGFANDKIDRIQLYLSLH
ncbi:MAG: hypothetical protein COA50_15220 [Flavobacteriaceae bacterium]|nr:MAG: hypothetical protein COA50_15220 [Flavobacteriaceae bacterium]